MPPMISNATPGLLRLCEVPAGEIAKIVQLLLPPPALEYVMQLGFVPDAQVEVVRKLPFRGPTVYRVQGTEIAIRHEVAERIQVRMRVSQVAGDQ